MKSEKFVMWAVMAFFSIIVSMGLAEAGPNGGWESAVRIQVGETGATAAITGSSFTGTAFVDATHLRPDGMYRNNTATEIWIGTTSATKSLGTHENQRIGFPVISSEVFKLGGSFTGTWYFTCAPTVAACEVRRLEGRGAR